MKAKLITGFGLLVLLVMVMGGVSVWQLTTITEHVGKLYRHPFTVSRLASGIRLKILGRHRNMQEILG